jgi:hypothetical protein
MPAQKHTRKATTPKLRRQWQHVRDSMEARGAPVGTAIAAASGVVKKTKARAKGRRAKRR